MWGVRLMGFKGAVLTETRFGETRSLQVKVADAKYAYLIAKCTDKGRTLYGCNMQFINSLLTRLKVMHVMAGEEITKKGEIPRELWFVLDGAVHLMDDDNRIKRSIRNDVPDISPIVGEVRVSIRWCDCCRANASAAVVPCAMPGLFAVRPLWIFAPYLSSLHSLYVSHSSESQVPFFLGVNHTHTIRARPDGDVQLLVRPSPKLPRAKGCRTLVFAHRTASGGGSQGRPGRIETATWKFSIAEG